MHHFLRNDKEVGVPLQEASQWTMATKAAYWGGVTPPKNVHQKVGDILPPATLPICHMTSNDKQITFDVKWAIWNKFVDITQFGRSWCLNNCLDQSNHTNWPYFGGQYFMPSSAVAKLSPSSSLSLAELALISISLHPTPHPPNTTHSQPDK